MTESICTPCLAPGCTGMVFTTPIGTCCDEPGCDLYDETFADRYGDYINDEIKYGVLMEGEAFTDDAGNVYYELVQPN